MKLAEIDLIDTDPLDDNLIEILYSSIQTGDFSILFDILKGENSYLKQLNGIYSKINNYVLDSCSDLHSSQIVVSNALQLLTELIQNFGIREIQCLRLSRTILSLIIDEQCSIINIKRAVNVLNSLVKKQSVISSLIQDDALEGSLQIFGRKIPEIGDYECQALLYEALYRITCDKNREYWANIWFLDPVAKNMFLSLDPGKFETNCRAALNYINRNELDRRVFSVIAYCVSFGSFELKQPSGSEFWIDFNYGSHSISFYCSELSVNDSLNDSDLWETILINNPSVTSYYIEENEAEKVKVVTLILNCPCQNLMTCSVISNPAFNSFEIKLSFHGLYDVYTHLEAIYGREKFRIDPLPKKPKISDCSDVIKCSDIFENGTTEALSNEIFSKRKISDSYLILIKTKENEDVPEMEETQQLAMIFESSEPLKIPKVEHIENIQHETHPAKKIYNSEPILLTSIPEIETLQDSNVPQRFSEISSAKRKVSCSSINIKINDDYEHQVIEGQEIQKEELTMSQGKKAKLTNSSSLDNSNTALVKGMIDKTASNAELQGNLKSSTNKFMSSQAHINSIDISTSKYGKKDFSEENVDSYSVGICDKKEVIDSVDKNKTKDNSDSDERNSVVSDVFSDVSMIEDSQTKTRGSVEKSRDYLRNRLKRPSSVPLELSTAPKEKVLRRTASMSAAYYLNGFHESPEDDYEIIPCSKSNKLSCLLYSEKNEGQERQSNVEKKRKKRRTRRRSRRISDRKISPASKTSSSSPDNINIKNLKPLEDKKNSANERKPKKVCNMKEQIRKPINSVNIPTDNNISTSEIHRNDSTSLKKHHLDLNLTLNLTDKNSFENIQKEISDESCVILDENVVVVEDSFNEKRYPEKSMQDDENKTSSSPKNISEEKSVHLSPAVHLQNQEDTFLTCIEKIAKNDEKKSSEKPKTHSVPNISSPKNKEDDSKVCGINNESQVPYKESGESSKGTTNSESAPKKQPPKKRLYNLDNAPVFDVPPSKFSNKSPKRGFSDHSVWNLNTDEEHYFEDSRDPNSDRKNVSNIKKNNNLRISDDKLKIYDRIAESDEDFEEHNNRDVKETRKRPRAMSQRKSSSKKKKTEVLQTNKNVKSTRTRREAAVKAMKVNKRILDPAPEVACDEIEVMGESDDSPKNTAHKPGKKRKYSKVFGSSRHSSTETGSSEVSWLKKPCPLFESPKRSYSQWKKKLKKRSLPVKSVPAKNLPVKSLPVKVVSTSKPTPRKTHHTISTETGSKSKSMNWSDLENFNLTVEKNTKKSYPVLHDLENHMKSLSTTSHNRNDKDLSSNNVPFQTSSLRSKHASDESNVLEQYNEPNNDYDIAYENDHHNDSRERYNYRDNHDISDSHEDKHEMKGNRKQKSTSNNYKTSDEVATLKSLAKSTTLVPQSVETYDSLHKERGSECSQSLPPEDECYSRFDINENIPLKDFGNETKGKQLHLQRFLECAVRYSESQKSSSLPNMNSSLDHSKDNAESAESRETVNKVIRSKSDELPTSQARQKNKKHKYPTDADTLEKNTVEDLIKENSKYFKDCTIDELTLRQSVDLVPQEDKSVNFEMKRKKTYCGSEEKMFERHQKKSKLNENLTLLKNCTIDSLSLMHSSGHSRDEKSSKNTDNYGFANKISRKGCDSRNSELNRSGSLTKKSTLKSNSILNNSRLTTVSFKETEGDNNWSNREYSIYTMYDVYRARCILSPRPKFCRITFQLSQDADAMARRLLATVQKCFYDFSTKMCFLRENIIKTTETFQMSSIQNVNVSKLKNLIQTCRIIRTEVEKSLKAMEMTGKEYFETEEKHYRKLRHKYIKACKKYMSSMENAKLNAIHNLEGNVILKAKNFFRKFLKYIDTA